MGVNASWRISANCVREMATRVERARKLHSDNLMTYRCDICHHEQSSSGDACPICGSDELTTTLSDNAKELLPLIDGRAHQGRGLASYPLKRDPTNIDIHRLCLELESHGMVYRVREHAGYVYWRANSELPGH